MTNESIVHQGVLCTSCGLKTAIIEEICGKVYQTELRVRHNYCGFETSLDKYISDIFMRFSIYSAKIQIHKDTIDVELCNDISDRVVEAFKKVVTETNAYLKQLTIHLEVKPEKLSCPICGNTEFETTDQGFKCSGHYYVPAREYFERFLELNSFGIYQETNETETIFRTTCVSKPTNFALRIASMLLSATEPVANIIYRKIKTNTVQKILEGDGPRHVLIISKREMCNEKEYANFVTLLKTNLSHCFDIIVKID